jgi:hypothetical protein
MSPVNDNYPNDDDVLDQLCAWEIAKEAAISTIAFIESQIILLKGKLGGENE